MKRLFSFVVPGGILFAAALVMVHMGEISASLPAIIRIYPYIVFAAAVLLGWRFNRSSLVFAAMCLAVADRSLLSASTSVTSAGMINDIVFNSVCVLLPVNLAVLCLMKERGIFTIHGIVRMVLLALQPCIIAVFITINPERLLHYLTYSFVDWNVFPRIPLSQPGVAAFCLATLIVAAKFFRNRGAKESGFFWVIVTILVSLTTVTPGVLSVFYFSTAGLILIISVIEASYAMAFRDELTGLPARRALKEDMLKLGSRYALAMLDIDHFKKFNDRHGHDVGDQVLRMVASKLSNVSGGGRAYRYGGEEFALIFSGKYADDAADHLEELRKDVASSGFALRGSMRPMRKPKKPRKKRKQPKRVSVTVSIGLAGRDGNNTKPFDVLKAADKALYRAKKAGRNRLAA
ncbi:MAG TPA: GGDEF domain-containing protein [Deltaproteobacteria bacterium]|nr:GGDEF domain-containing protein [Deltaproteobacteria bacterium]HPJ93943.1 GGDEF domain-containing protein [Deltaproteobacteria bacterium]HPR51330.1 GGDEF domain-containing protein [Deltaproteobacteria bacterium]